LNKNLLKTTQRVWKTLVVLTVSVLLLLPTPVLALNYDGALEIYRSKPQFKNDDVLQLIQKLPNQSYDNGKISLAEIESKLKEIEAKMLIDYQILKDASEKTQISYENNLESINRTYSEQERLTKEFSLCDERERDIAFRERGYAFALAFFGSRFRELPSWKENCYPILNSLNSIKQLEEENQRLSQDITFADQLSKVYKTVEQRIKLAKRKVRNIQESADVTHSFISPDMDSQIKELQEMVENLTKNI
ncbi:MAG: hypothetical protein ACKPH7_29010, partial [Planktothrix sp.]|uniref:hypothetical protein n=1 Tax=Planktothrix sp. TaxID=3088171 RepID=UPI0038D362FC